MRISIVTVGTRMPPWVSQGVEEYSKRMPRELNIEWKELPLAARGKNASAEKLREKEGQQILKAIPSGDRVIALDVRGQALSTERMAEALAQWQMSGENYSLMIGGPDGLSADCLQRAERRWSLSGLTLPHPLVRILLAEQLYRAWTITVNHPYHRQ
ncbi:23S rRNA (pseudouridine(1915)-N(3))-methyltransferase RlmH [Pseudohalioglobus lutimaris]|uniref:Ribosomal RNA large subunit methyltransferase H n=1 Tax=Pseudohalioglobus lutimaris TaxID=1737061 RepID=A0A2N5WZ63_9GAMM|nr:23S rRNA (pseudouridine(1915)-N(3))-methyltransferase RlmH [Pseudohalioglobus lutimaris]PLW67509.1 23S rRNA (pseudouridine(1915)-N(3))-methyltransferase RlmH [Pseudohalioglobus lutimaris]